MVSKPRQILKSHYPHQVDLERAEKKWSCRANPRQPQKCWPCYSQAPLHTNAKPFPEVRCTVSGLGVGCFLLLPEMAVPSWGSGGVSGATRGCLSNCCDGKGHAPGSRKNVRQNREGRKALTPLGAQNMGASPSRSLHPNRWANVLSKCLRDKKDGHKDQDSSGWLGHRTIGRLLKPANPLPHDMSELGPLVHPPWEALVWGENISI